MLEKEMVGRCSFFKWFPKDKLSEIARLGEILEVDSEAVIFKEGETAVNLYGVLDGEIELSLVFEDKILKKDIRYEDYIHTSIETIERNIIFDCIKPCDIFGWSALTKPNRFTATAKATKPSRIFFMPATDLEDVLAKNPQLGYAFMLQFSELISQRLIHRTDKLIECWHACFESNRI